MFFFFQDPETLPIFGPELQKLEMTLDVLRELDPRMTIGALTAFIYVARRLSSLASGQENLRHIAEEMNIPYPTLLRHTDFLAEGIPNKPEGLGLLEKGPHPHDKRSRQVRLTDKGIEALRKIEKTLACVPVSATPA